jgi:hypothetical protein
MSNINGIGLKPCDLIDLLQSAAIPVNGRDDHSAALQEQMVTVLCACVEELEVVPEVWVTWTPCMIG